MFIPSIQLILKVKNKELSMSLIDFDKELKERSLLAISVLSAENEKIKEIVGKADYDPESLNLKIEVNGVEVQNKSFKLFLDILYKDLKENVVADHQAQVQEAAEMIVIEKMTELVASMSTDNSY